MNPRQRLQWKLKARAQKAEKSTQTPTTPTTPVVDNTAPVTTPVKTTTETPVTKVTLKAPEVITTETDVVETKKTTIKKRKVGRTAKKITKTKIQQWFYSKKDPQHVWGFCLIETNYEEGEVRPCQPI